MLRPCNQRSQIKPRSFPKEVSVACNGDGETKAPDNGRHTADQRTKDDRHNMQGISLTKLNQSSEAEVHKCLRRLVTAKNDPDSGAMLVRGHIATFHLSLLDCWNFVRHKERKLYCYWNALSGGGGRALANSVRWLRLRGWLPRKKEGPEASGYFWNHILKAVGSGGPTQKCAGQNPTKKRREANCTGSLP